MEQLLERLRVLQAADDSRAEALRMLGGLLLGAGALVLAVRTSSLDNHWAKFPELLVFLLPSVFLLVVGLGSTKAIGEIRPWHAVYAIFGLLLLPIALLQFVDTIGGSTDSNWNTAWIFAVTAAVAAFAGIQRIRFGWLVCGLSLLVVWFAFWGEAISGGAATNLDTFRVLALIAAAGLIGGGYYLRDRDGEIGSERAAEWFTAGGIAFIVGAGLFSLIGSAAGLVSGISTPVAGEPGLTSPAQSIGGASVGWDAVLGLGSALLIGSGTYFRHRGPVYVGAAGILLFVFIVGLDLDDDSPSGHVLGWPVVLLLLAGAAVFLSLTPQGRKPSGGASATAGNTEPPASGTATPAATAPAAPEPPTQQQPPAAPEPPTQQLPPEPPTQQLPPEPPNESQSPPSG